MPNIPAKKLGTTEKVKKFFTKKYEPYVIGRTSIRNNKVKLNGNINWT